MLASTVYPSPPDHLDIALPSVQLRPALPSTSTQTGGYKKAEETFFKTGAFLRLENDYIRFDGNFLSESLKINKGNTLL